MHVEVESGVSLHVRELGGGAGADGESAPVVMIHGLTLGNMATWYFTTAPALAPRHRVVMYDLRGHGMSTKARSGYDLATMCADLGTVIERTVGARRVTLVGHSYGGVTAMRFALRHPDLVSKLVVVDAPLPPSSLTDVDALVGKKEEEVVGAISVDSIPEVLQQTTLAEGRRRRRFGDGLRFLAHETSLFADLRAAEDFSDAELAAIGCPTLAIYGTKSICRPAGRRIAKHCPQGALVELEGGHMLTLERPRELTDAIVAFIDGQVSRG